MPNIPKFIKLSVGGEPLFVNVNDIHFVKPLTSYKTQVEITYALPNSLTASTAVATSFDLCQLYDLFDIV